MNKLRVFAIAPFLVLLATYVQAQQGDVAFGVGTLLAPSSATSSNHTNQSMGGGTFLAFSADGLIKHYIGVQGEVAWRATQNTYSGFQPFRPILFAFNGIWAPRYGRISPELIAGIGGSSTRFYTPYFFCTGSSVILGCTNYSSSTHFMGDFGGGIKVYVHRGIFIRPEFRLYLIHNNVEFSSGRAERVGASLGYTFGGGGGLMP